MLTGVVKHFLRIIQMTNQMLRFALTHSIDNRYSYAITGGIIASYT